VNCSSAERSFEDFLEGTLAVRTRSALLAHVERCDTCRGLLEELRVVDALLLEPREIRLAENFTFAMMAEVRSQPPPRRPRSRLGAFVAAYLAATWIAIGALFILAPHTMGALAGAALGFSRALGETVGGIGQAVASVFGQGTPGVVLAVTGVLALETFAAFVIAGAIRYLRPRLAERRRS